MGLPNPLGGPAFPLYFTYDLPSDPSPPRCNPFPPRYALFNPPPSIQASSALASRPPHRRPAARCSCSPGAHLRAWRMTRISPGERGPQSIEAAVRSKGGEIKCDACVNTGYHVCQIYLVVNQWLVTTLSHRPAAIRYYQKVYCEENDCSTAIWENGRPSHSKPPPTGSVDEY